jgi:hypothetical protein
MFLRQCSLARSRSTPRIFAVYIQYQGVRTRQPWENALDQYGKG